MTTVDAELACALTRVEALRKVVAERVVRLAALAQERERVERAATFLRERLLLEREAYSELLLERQFWVARRSPVAKAAIGRRC